MALKTWDQYVREANRKPVTLRLPGGKTVKATYFTNERAAKFNIALMQGDKATMLTALFGEGDGALMAELLKDAPFGVLDAIVNDVLVEFGLRAPTEKPADEKDTAEAVGKSETSSN